MSNLPDKKENLSFDIDYQLPIGEWRSYTYRFLNHSNLMYCAEKVSFIKGEQSFHPYHGILL